MALVQCHKARALLARCLPAAWQDAASPDVVSSRTTAHALVLARFAFAVLCLVANGTVTLDIKARVVTVKGPRGTLTKSFKHMAVDIYKVEDGKVKVEKWFGATKESASIRSCCSHMLNMITGVTKVRAAPHRSPCSQWRLQARVSRHQGSSWRGWRC